MGNCVSSSGQVGYAELRESIPGSLVSDQDFELFYSLCKVESARSISSIPGILIPNQCPLFYVVVSGEVRVHLSSIEMKNKSTVAAIFTKGETIHFFNAALRTTNFPRVTALDFGEILRDNCVKLALHLKNLPNSTARVIGMDRRALEEFQVLAGHNTRALTSFLGLSMAEMTYTSPYLKTMTQEQAAMFGILMKVRLSHTGGIISPVENEFLTCQSDSSSKSLRASQSFDARCCTAAGPVSFIFSGTALVVPYGAPLNPQMQKLQQAHSMATPKSSHTPNLFRASTSTLLSPLNTFAGFYKRPTDVPAIFSASLGRAALDKDQDHDVYLRQHLMLSSGMMLGLAGVFCRETHMPPLSVVASSPCVIGYFTYETIDTFFAVDPRLCRVLQRNFFMQLLTWFKPTVPFLREMEDWSFAPLSCKIALKCFPTGTVIYKRGSPSDFAYIIVSGSIQETIESSALRMSPGSTKDGSSVKIERVLNTGTLFGEVALASNSPYFSTVTTKEPTMVMCMSKHVLEQIYNNNKTKLCEIRIRLLGGDAALQHVVDHPRGCQLFQAYLDKEMAGESLRFYTAVDRFDAMCRDVVRQHRHLTRACARYKRELTSAYDTTDYSEGSRGHRGMSYDGSNENDAQIIDLETEDNNDISLSAMSVPDTATRQTSFFSDGGDVTVCEVVAHPARQTGLTTPTGSRRNSVDSDVFIQHSAQANSSNFEMSSLLKPLKHTGKPALESIISESNLPFHDSSKKFSMKFKPIPQNSAKINQVLPLTENEQEDDLESAHVNQPVITVAARRPAAADATAISERAADLENAKEVARTITQKLHRIQKNIVELKQVARPIMQTYICNGSEFQVNLPSAVRSRTEEKFKDWTTSLLASMTRDALAQGRADGGFHSVQLSVDRKYSFDFSDEPVKDGKNAIENVTSLANGAGGHSIRSESFEFTPASHINADFTPSSVNYSADDYGQGASVLGSPSSSFKASAPFLTSLGPQGSAHYEHAKNALFMPAPIKIPNRGFLSSAGSASCPLHAHKDNASQAHMPVETNHMIAVQVQSLDLSFVNLFTKSKQEILKLLRDDKFPRFKSTQEFQQFIHVIKPYVSSVMSAEHVTSFHNLDNSSSVQSIAQSIV